MTKSRVSFSHYLASAAIFAAAGTSLACAAVAATQVSNTPNTLSQQEVAAGWQLLFDGKSLDDWKASDAPGTFTVANGEIVVHGPQSHLYYLGPVHDHDFKNFVLKCDVMTWHGANSGVYFHTKYQASDWPAAGFEAQVDNTDSDPKRTASLYDIKDNYATVARDNKWFTMQIRVVGKHVVISIDGKTVTDYTEPETYVPPANHPGRRISHGTFALQGHDPDSEIHFRNIKVRVLP